MKWLEKHFAGIIVILCVWGVSAASFRLGESSRKISNCSTKQSDNSSPQFVFRVFSGNDTNECKDYAENNAKTNSVIYRNVFLTNDNGDYHGEANETYDWNGNVVYIHFSFSQRSE